MKTSLQKHDALIIKARKRDPIRLQARWYCEWHHINPRSLGGGDEPANLVLLTYREHRMIHKWLIDIVPEGERWKMQSALGMFYDKNGNVFSEQERKEHRDATSEALRHGKCGIGNKTARNKKNLKISNLQKGEKHWTKNEIHKGRTELARYWRDKEQTILLFIGTSQDTWKRNHNHNEPGTRWAVTRSGTITTAYWYLEVDNYTIEVFATRDEARAAKKIAIKNEKPKYAGKCRRLYQGNRTIKQIEYRR